MGAGKKVGARVIHDAEVAAIVHVPVEIDVVGPDTKCEAIFIEDVEVGQWTQMLADSERWNADEVDEMGHGRGPLPGDSVVEDAGGAQ